MGMSSYKHKVTRHTFCGIQYVIHIGPFDDACTYAAKRISEVKDDKSDGRIGDHCQY